MADMISAQLYFKACFVRARLRGGNMHEIKTAREALRNAMTAHYFNGYWKDKPEVLREYMSLLNQCENRLKTFVPALALAKGSDAALDA